MCGWARPPDYEVPAELQAEEEQRQLKLPTANFLNSCPDICDHVFTDASGSASATSASLMNLTQGSLIPVPAQQGFECPICLCDVGGDDDDGDGIRGLRLRECGHEDMCCSVRRGARSAPNARCFSRKRRRLRLADVPPCAAPRSGWPPAARAGDPAARVTPLAAAA
uniref:RING-type domain-containing protein n=1 Tax=Macrostomum lignano TaxID=282301 RepID=A0A1I8F738_9PLAT